MQETNLIFTDLPKGANHLFSNKSYLDKAFFDQYPVKDPKEVAYGGSDTTKFSDAAKLEPVNIEYMYVGWLTRFKESEMFLQNLSGNDKYIKLFANRNMQVLINFMWDISRSYFIWWDLIPFLILGYIPVHVIALTAAT